MNPELARGVREHRLLVFRYEDLDRTVEPHLYGVHRDSGNEILIAWQVGGFSHSADRPGWRNFIATDIRQLRLLGETFASPRPGYNASDERFRFVFERV